MVKRYESRRDEQTGLGKREPGREVRVGWDTLVQKVDGAAFHDNATGCIKRDGHEMMYMTTLEPQVFLPY